MMNSVHIFIASGQRGSVRSDWVTESGLSIDLVTGTTGEKRQITTMQC